MNFTTVRGQNFRDSASASSDFEHHIGQFGAVAGSVSINHADFSNRHHKITSPNFLEVVSASQTEILKFNHSIHLSNQLAALRSLV